MDNASNCDKLAQILGNSIEGFMGEPGQLHCIAHIINLVAKVSELAIYYLILTEIF